MKGDDSLLEQTWIPVPSNESNNFSSFELLCLEENIPFWNCRCIYLLKVTAFLLPLFSECAVLLWGKFLDPMDTLSCANFGKTQCLWGWEENQRQTNRRIAESLSKSLLDFKHSRTKSTKGAKVPYTFIYVIWCQLFLNSNYFFGIGLIAILGYLYKTCFAVRFLCLVKFLSQLKYRCEVLCTLMVILVAWALMYFL